MRPGETPIFFGFERGMPAFLAALDQNNSREWFRAHKADYDRLVARPMAALAEAMAPTMMGTDRDLRKKLSRPHRDIRFSPDKRPYRCEAWFAFHRSAPEWSDTPAFFFEVTPGASRWGMGFYSAKPATMASLRDLVERRPGEFASALDAARVRSFAIEGKPYRRARPVPEGIGGDAAEIFSRRTFYLEHVDGQSCHVLEPGLETRLAADFDALAPLYRLLLSVRQGG